MQQRQLRLGDILDDYCPRERRVTNHAIVAMIGPDVKQTRCTTCDTEHEFKHARVPRQRRKSETPAALYSQVAANAPKRVAHEAPVDTMEGDVVDETSAPEPTPNEPLEAHAAEPPTAASEAPLEADDPDDDAAPADHEQDDQEEGPVHRPLIRATLPRPEGTPPPTRPAPDFTIRQPGGRQNRFRPRHGRGPQFHGDHGIGNTGGGPMRTGSGMRHGGGRPQGAMASRLSRRDGPGRKRSK